MYIIFDLEFNQDFYDETKKVGSKFPFEIIQIGAIKLDSRLNYIDSFNRYIKPTIYNRVSPFIEDLTGINDEMLINEKTFTDVYDEFVEFIETEESIFGVWGMSDIKELFKSANFHHKNTELLPKMFINIQTYASIYFNMSKNTQLRLENVVEMLGLPMKKEFHNALNDSYYTAEIFKKIYNESIQPDFYNPNYVRQRIKQAKRVIDTEALIRQFEKMYNKSISEEEKSMIILAYKMGKTGQFLKME